MTTHRLWTPLVLLAFATPALAQQLEGTYRLTGTHDAAPNVTFQSEITIRKTDTAWRVTRKVTLGDGSTSTRTGDADPGQVTAVGLQVALTGSGGMTALLAPGQTVPAGTVLLDFTVDANGLCTARTRDAQGRAVATGERRIEELGGAANGLLIYTKGGVKTILGKGIEKLFESGVGIGHTLKMGDAFHVGLELETQLLEDGELLPLQREVLEGQATRHVWLQTDVEGGARIPLRTTIPVGGAGNVSLGFVPGAKLRYEVTDLYETPSGITDGKQILAVIKQASRHVYETTIEGRQLREGRIVEMPITAAEAQALQVGAERHVEGEWTVALNGSIGVGETTQDVSPLEIGATARVGGFYRIRDWLRVELTRLPGAWVRVHLMDGRRDTYGADARAFVGASLNTDEETGGWSPSAEYLEPVVDVVNDQVIEKLLRFEITAQKGKESKQELDLSYRFDLSNANAAAAYERAVKGDFTLAAKLFGDPANGIVREFRVVELEERFFERGDLELSIFANGELREDVEISEMFIQDPAGNHFHRVFRFQDERKLGLGAIWEQKWSERIYVSVIRSDDVDDPQVGVNPDGSFDIPVWLAQRSFRFRYDLRDAHLRKGEAERLKNVLAQLGLGDAAGIPVPEQRLFRSRYGKARARLEVDIAEWGIRTIMAKVLGEPQTVRQAYLDSYAAIKGPADNWFKRKTRERKADAFMEGMNALARNDVPDRAQALNELCEQAGWDMTMLGAIVSLTPRRHVRVQAQLDGKRISYAAENAGTNSNLQIPNLYGH